MIEDPQFTYNSITDIRLRKEILHNEILEDNEKIKTLWGSLFKKSDALNKRSTPSKRINSILNIGAGVLDGVILGWKLYRKFKK
jgi:hypothetical protein